ncbi:hypothetical protein [uncultured Zoogloea sp.]|jgi:hypothetical protein|uniref:hypothetical protein n=1 Tax=uncultured Zoogloea sp. TaxID=160237 RepID=UPI00261BDF5D|nr:hypothetical protein [uncultured Zoogloea sp.]
MAKGGGKPQGDEGPQISPEERARIAKAAKQVAAYANFLRWSANFQKDEFTRHPRHDRVILLSAMQSGRFSFAVESDTIYLGVQPFEAVWLSTLPIDKVYVSDRLYLSIEGVACMDSKLPALGIGIFVDDQAKRAEMAAAKWLQPVRVEVSEGRVVSVDREIGTRVPVTGSDIITALASVAKAKLKQQDMSRFF